MDEPLGRQLAMTAKAVQAHADAILAGHGASLTTWVVLVHADAAKPPGLSQTELAGNVAIGAPSLVRHIDRLERDGLLRRRGDAEDRRITRIVLTPKGRRLLGKLRTVMYAEDQKMRARLSTSEVRTLERVLTKLNDHASPGNRAEPARRAGAVRPKRTATTGPDT